mgnify:CR=1 FL=1
MAPGQGGRRVEDGRGVGDRRRGGPGILDAEVAPHTPGHDVRDAIAADPALTARQKKTLLDIYESYVEDTPTATTPTPRTRTSPSTTKN